MDTPVALQRFSSGLITWEGLYGVGRFTGLVYEIFYTTDTEDGEPAFLVLAHLPDSISPDTDILTGKLAYIGPAHDEFDLGRLEDAVHAAEVNEAGEALLAGYEHELSPLELSSGLDHIGDLLEAQEEAGNILSRDRSARAEDLIDRLT